MEISTPFVLKKSKRLTSVVWNDFERVKRGDVCFAVCKHCNKKLSGSSSSGTSHLRNHLKRCRKRCNLEIPPQLLLVREKKKEPNNAGTITLGNYKFDEPNKDGTITFGNFKYDQGQKRDEPLNLGNFMFDEDRSQLDLARMIILHGYPLAMVEHAGFKVFVKNLQPLFKFITCNTLEAYCMGIYETEKQKVSQTLNRLPGRISLTVDTWASSESGGYLRLTAHYIDQAWQLQKKILNFVLFDRSHTEVLSEVILTCMRDWNIDGKLFGMTLDDCLTSDNIVFRIKDQLNQNQSLLSEDRLVDVRCAAHILNLIAQDALTALHEVTHKIRESIRYVKSSPEKFNQMAQQVRVQSQKSLCLDSPVRWNSTYLMLEIALEHRDAFSLLQEHDPSYRMALSDLEWERASAITNCLKLLYEVSNVLLGMKFPTANLYFPEICDINLQLIEWCKNSDIVIANMASKMKVKFDKYWNTCSLALAIATILDPRFKMKLVEYYYSQIYGNNAPNRIKEVSEGIKKLYNEYSISSTFASLDQGLTWDGRSNTGFNGGYFLGGGGGNDTRDRLRGFDKFLHETSQTQPVKSDLDKYLEEPVYPRNIDFNILNWWKVHTPRFPILSMMARDVFAISMSTIESEPTFNTGGRLLDPYRSSLNPDIVQALICTQDWLRSGLEDSESSSSQSALTLCIEAS